MVSWPDRGPPALANGPADPALLPTSALRRLSRLPADGSPQRILPHRTVSVAEPVGVMQSCCQAGELHRQRSQRRAFERQVRGTR